MLPNQFSKKKRPGCETGPCSETDWTTRLQLSTSTRGLPQGSEDVCLFFDNFAPLFRAGIDCPKSVRETSRQQSRSSVMVRAGSGGCCERARKCLRDSSELSPTVAGRHDDPRQ